MRDLISRQMAIDTIKSVDDYTSTFAAYILGSAIDAIKELPSADQDLGKWTLDIDDSFPLLRRGWRCSECGRRQTYGKTPYCPYCGRKMEVKK